MTDDSQLDSTPRDARGADDAPAPAPGAAAPGAPHVPGAPGTAATPPGPGVQQRDAPPSGARMPEYRGEELDAERGPGLGCFWFQVILLVVFFILTPVTVELAWPPVVSAVLLFITLGLLLFVGQTVIFLLRIVAAERRGRRRPLASPTPTVGEIEETVGTPADSAGDVAAAPATAPEGPEPDPAAGGHPGADESVRQ